MKKRWLLIVSLLLLILVFLIRRTGVRPYKREVKKRVYEEAKRESLERKRVVISKPKRKPQRKLPPISSYKIDTIGMELQVVTPAEEVAERELGVEERGSLDLKIGELSDSLRRGEMGGIPYPEVEIKPRLTRATRPPSFLKKGGLVRARIGEDGIIDSVQMAEPVSPSTESLISSVVREFRFEPGLHKGEPVKVEILIPIQISE